MVRGMSSAGSAGAGGVVKCSAPARKLGSTVSDIKIREEGFGFGEVAVVPAPAPRVLVERMATELDAVLSLVKKAELLSRASARGRGGATPAGKNEAAAATKRREAFSSDREAAKRREAFQSDREAAKRREAFQSDRVAAKRKEAFQSDRDAAAAKRRKVESAPRRSSEVRQQPAETQVATALRAAQAARRQQEIARAREKFRQELLEVERAAQPDEAIPQQVLEDLGIVEYQYNVTRTRKQAEDDQRRRASASHPASYRDTSPSS